jgi:hypothetical protein
LKNKLKNLTQEDLNQISDFISSSAQNFISQKVSQKEINDLDIKVELSYDEKLEVDITIDLSLDDLSSASPDIVDEAIEHSFEVLEPFLDLNFRT